MYIVVGFCFAYVFLESYISQWVGFSSLLATITIGIVILAKRKPQVKRLAQKCDRLWSFSEIFLFVLVGAPLNINAVSGILLPSLFLIIIGLIFRLLGTFVCTIKTKQTFKERVFVSLSYIPKATVQATIDGSLLDLGNKLGNITIQNAGMIVLAASIISILLTAHLRAFAIDLSVNKLTLKGNNDTAE